MAEPASLAGSAGKTRSTRRPAEDHRRKGRRHRRLKEAFVPTLVKVRDGLSEQHTALGGGIRQVQQQFDEGLRALAAMLQPVIAHFQPPPEAAPISGDWQEAILGRDLAEYPGLDRQRQRLLSGFLQGDAAAGALIGQLMVFRSSPAEKMPTLLKDIGEAYYRWNPRTGRADEMENALVAWLQRACEHSGMSNTIELVHPGQHSIPCDTTPRNGEWRSRKCSAGSCCATTAKFTPRPA